jgi:hypothetical protein
MAPEVEPASQEEADGVPAGFSQNAFPAYRLEPTLLLRHA